VTLEEEIYSISSVCQSWRDRCNLYFHRLFKIFSSLDPYSVLLYTSNLELARYISVKTLFSGGDDTDFDNGNYLLALFVEFTLTLVYQRFLELPMISSAERTSIKFLKWLQYLETKRADNYV